MEDEKRPCCCTEDGGVDGTASTYGIDGTEATAGADGAKSAANTQCGCHLKATPRSQEMQADLQKRLNRIIGQLNGVKSMIDGNRYCGDVLTQLAAAESALRSVSIIVLQNHMETCVVEQVQQGNTEVVDEVMQLMKRFS